MAESHDLSLVVLFGSGARPNPARLRRDCDLAVQGASGEVNVIVPTNAFFRELRIQNVDLVDLPPSDPLMLQLAADTGRILFEAEPGLHARFCSLAARRYAETWKFTEMEKAQTHEWLARGPADRTCEKDDVG